MEEEQREEFVKVCEPLMEWLAKNHHPHVQVIVNSTSAEMVEGVVVHRTDKFIQD